MAADRISVHRVKGQFYGFKKMVGGERFYFGREFGILDDAEASQQRARAIAGVYVEEWRRQRLAGQTEWTDAARARAKALARAMLGVHTLPADHPPIGYELDVRFSTSTPVRSDRPLMLHEAMTNYCGRVRKTAESGQISHGRADTIIYAVNRARRMIPDRRLSSFGLADCRQFVELVASRPVQTEGRRKGQRIAPDTAIDTIVATRAFFEDANLRGEWKLPATLNKCFRFKRNRLQTEDELEETSVVKTFSLDELRTLWRFCSTEQQMLFFCLGINCGFTQKEISSLRRSHCHLNRPRPYVKRKRHKTKVLGRWSLWPETAYLLNKLMAPENPRGLALLTENGNPLCERTAKSRYDLVKDKWKRTLDQAVKGHDNERRTAYLDPRRPVTSVLVRRLGYKYLRKTGSELVRRTAGSREFSEVFLTHKDRTMGHVYNNADFKRLGKVLRRIRRRLQPVFSAAPYHVPAEKLELYERAA